ncbi:MAG: aminotransferase class I/II-fold pyridoxal phosphate-dependent enzyme [Alphaproteobacteria bacterium]|nr:aminotransferase class I/II-fold pyridoxal phosphate-dependent enzyme [Alphaproteobacteria bacterium]
MNLQDIEKYDLGDFYHTDSDNPVYPGADFTTWKANMASVFGLFEPSLAAGPAPRTQLATRAGKQSVINLTSYNYLGLAQHPEVVQASIEALKAFGTGACGSPMLSGMTVLHRELESSLASFAQREQALLFNSGNAGAIGMISAMLRRGDVAVMDEHSHICLIEGAKLCGAKLQMFAHNDASDLDRILEKNKGCRRVVIIEALYSMHGDFADLASLVPVARNHGVDVVLDEAHSILAVGANGRGAAELYGVEGDVALSYGTFSKAFGNIGAYLAGADEALDYIRFYANTYVFSVALPPAVVAGVKAALEVATRDNDLRVRLHDNADYLRSALHSLGISTGSSNSHIVPIVLGSGRRLLYELTHELREQGLFVAPVDYPSVPEDQLRFRACVTSAHTKSDLDDALNIIEDVVVPRLRARAC